MLADTKTYDICTVFQVLGYMASAPLVHEDMYNLGQAAMKKYDYGLAAQWLDKCTEDADPDFPIADAYLQLAMAHNAVCVQTNLIRYLDMYI